MRKIIINHVDLLTQKEEKELCEALTNLSIEYEVENER